MNENKFNGIWDNEEDIFSNKESKKKRKKINKKLKLNLTEQEKKDIIYEHHNLTKLLPKKKLKKLELEFTSKEELENLKFAQTIAKELKVDLSAVISFILKRFLESEKNA